MSEPRMRPPHAKFTVLALCGLAAAAGVGAASPAVNEASLGPVAAYGFDEGRGQRVADASDNSNDGATTARRTEAGRFGRALRMYRPSEAAIVPDDASLRPRKTVTLEAWVYPERGRGSRAIVVKEGGKRVAYALSTTGGRPQAVVTSGSTIHLARAASPLKPGRWTHLTAIYDGRTIRLLVGGVQAARTPASGKLLTARGPLRIGAGGTGGNRFLGRIDEVRVYARALKDAEVVRDMRRAVRSDPSGGSTRPVIVRPAPGRPPVSPTPGAGSPRAGGGTLQWGYVANADFDNAINSAKSAHGTVIRMEFAIGSSPASMEGAVSNAASKGMEVLLLAGFHQSMPSTSQAQNLGNWARTFGPGGSFWAGRSDKQLASRFIEFGNESSFEYQGTRDRGGEYALRVRDAYIAMQAANPAMGLLVQADDGDCGCANWVNAMHAAVPDLGSMAAGWTVHPYGPRDEWTGRLDRLISQTAAVGWSSAIPIDITEWGLATDNGRNLDDNYGWPTNQTYQQAADAVRTTVDQMQAAPGIGSRLRLFTYFQGHDQAASGTSGGREHYFGAVQNNGSDKGALTASLRAIADAHPAH